MTEKENKFISNFIKELEEKSEHNVNREFSTIKELNILRIDLKFNDFKDVTNNEITYLYNFNHIFNLDEKIKIIKGLEQNLKQLKKEIKEAM